MELRGGMQPDTVVDEEGGANVKLSAGVTTAAVHRSEHGRRGLHGSCGIAALPNPAVGWAAEDEEKSASKPDRMSPPVPLDQQLLVGPEQRKREAAAQAHCGVLIEGFKLA